MDRNLVLSIILSIAIILGFQLYLQHFAPPPKKLPTITENTKQPAPAPLTPPLPKAPEEELPSTKAVAPEAAVTTPPPKAGIAPAKEVRIKVDSPKYEAVLSSKGGRLISFRLKEYTKSLNKPGLVNLFTPKGPDTSGPSVMFTRTRRNF